MNHTTMKATAVISEAWRSITSGAARLAPAVLALALTAAGMGVMDIAAGSTILDQASAYRQSCVLSSCYRPVWREFSFRKSGRF